MCHKGRVRGLVMRAGVSGVAMQYSSSELPAASQALTLGPGQVAADGSPEGREAGRQTRTDPANALYVM